jgi:NDP-sugar pyrophosphorylase family protein
MHTTLIIMAAGIGSRFGTGIKQLAKMTPNGEIIMDYSIYDAKQAGFDKVVFIIRKDIEKEFKEAIGDRISKYIDVEYVYQELENLPEGFSVPEGRTKPWGTGQAVLACRGVVKEPFVIINADDYYGKEAFVKLHDFLVSETEETADFTMAMAGFVLKNTVSENGTVTRGICVENEDGMLTQVIETSGIAMDQGKVVCENPQVQEWISPESKVSMNMWAGYPEFIDYLEEGFVRFLEDESGDPLKKEYLIPVIVDGLLKKNQAAVKVIPTSDKWIGITYHQDLEAARTDFAAMIKDKIYPEKLWN